MSALSLFTTNFYQPNLIQSTQQNLATEFQQLGQDIQSGNLSAAQQEFTLLTQTSSTSAQSASTGSGTAPMLASGTQGPSISAQPSSTTASAAGSLSLAQEFNSLGQALQSGNLAAAQQAYSAIQQDLPTAQAGQGHFHHHHHHFGGAQNNANQDDSLLSALAAGSSGSSSSSNSSSGSNSSSLLNLITGTALNAFL